MKADHIPSWISKKPEGQPTRGKTTRNRLRRVDNFLLTYDPRLLSRTDGSYARAFFVDLGYGDEAITTLESAKRLRTVNPDLPVLGVEIDKERVEKAEIYANEHTFFRLGGFNLPLQSWADGTPETVRLVRAFNVLRQYDEGMVVGAYERLFQCILPGGLLIEGTSDPFGRIWVANLARKPTDNDTGRLWEMEALVFSTNFRVGFDPAQFQAVLPKNYIHRVVPGELAYEFFHAWKQAAQQTSPMQVWGARQWFVSSAHCLADSGFRVNLHRKWLRKGWLIWEKPALGRWR